MKDIEIEFKNLLTKDQYNNLVDLNSLNSKKQLQINYYYDSIDNKLENLKIALRVRELNDTYTLTMKIPKTKNSVIEINELISKEEFIKLTLDNDIDNEITIELKKHNLKLSDLVLLGSLSTTRLEKQFDDYLLVLDKNNYNEIVDYEIEMEVFNEKIGEKIFKEYLKKYNIDNINTPSKIKRWKNSINN